MKIKGMDSENGFVEVGVLPIERRDGRKVELSMRSLPLGFTDVCEEKIPSPAPPAEGFVRGAGKKGKPFLRDPDTGKPVVFYNEKDLKYVARKREVNRLHTTMMLVESLKADPGVDFDVKREDCKTNEEYYSRIWEEFGEFGFSIGDLGVIVDFMQEISNISPSDLKEAREDFLPEE